MEARPISQGDRVEKPPCFPGGDVRSLGGLKLRTLIKPQFKPRETGNKVEFETGEER